MAALLILVLARTLHIGSAMLLVALPFFLLVIWRGNSSNEGRQNRQSFLVQVVKWWWGALVVEAISGAAWIWFVAAQMSDLSPWQMGINDFKIVLVQTWFGELWLARTAVGFVLGVLMFWRNRPGANASSISSGLVLALSSVLLVSLAGAGHAEAGIHYHFLHLAIDATHLLLGAVWPLGLVPLGFFLSGFNEDSSEIEETEIATLRRFSRNSLVVVLLLLATGLVNSFLMIGTWADLVTTIYGRLLVAKIVAVIFMIGLGALNRRCLIPGRREAPEKWRLRRNVGLESCLAAVVLVIVGIMGMTAPPP